MTWGVFDNDQDDITEKVWGDFDDSEGLHRMTLKHPLPFKDLVPSDLDVYPSKGGDESLI